jgi:hypothetical protein
VKKNQSPEAQAKALKKAIAAYLEKAFCVTETCVSSIRYFEKIDAIRINYRNDFAALVSAKGKSPAALLYEVISALGENGEKALRDIHWHNERGWSIEGINWVQRSLK